MKIKAIALTNIRGFRSLPKTSFSDKINVFIGANNSGKSTLLNSIFVIQRYNIIQLSDITIGEKFGEIKLFLTGDHSAFGNMQGEFSYGFYPLNQDKRIFNPEGSHVISPTLVSETEPNNIIYPYLSKRKSIHFDDQINEQNTNSVNGNFVNLFSKIDRLITPQFQPGNKQYIKACENILGFQISTLASPGGKKGVYFIHNQEHIPLTAMGEGVTNIIGLITDLCVAENKIFLIEELENDIHPIALKALLSFIVEKSSTNQFFISTHSNIVMKNLGAADGSKIFNITSELKDDKRPNMFLSSLNEIPDNFKERKAVLENLGYEFNDFGLWSAWLFLEESSAEILIRDWFIKWYVPELKDKLRTYSARSLSEILPKFDDFNKLFVFLHLEPLYKNKVWVIIDNGPNETAVIEKMRDLYLKSGWKPENFSQFDQHDFEGYYPSRFNAKVEVVLSETDPQKKRKLKQTLLNEVKDWIISDEKQAQEEFSISAKFVIHKLQEIVRYI
jgi:energy-coupling factor transporter ATP-binding protein EcfA2